MVRVDKKVRAVKVLEVFVANVHCTLKVVSMPTSEKDIGQFLTGPLERICSGGEGDKSGESDRERDEDDGESDKEDSPPKAKKGKRELKAMSVRSLHVSLSVHVYYMSHT